jgi:hypothetical protein
LYLLTAAIDFSNNLWTARLSLGTNIVPLFVNAPFNGTGQTLDLGYVAVEWQLTAASTNQHGNNWMLVADWTVRALPAADQPYRIETAGVDSHALPTLTWTGQPGFDYTVEALDDLRSGAWLGGLSNGVFTNVTVTGPLSFTDGLPATQRHYRLRRAYAP